jgi:hypothetical protein
MKEWGFDKQTAALQRSVRKVLNELESAALVFLNEPRFEVVVTPNNGFAAWAYFPVHRNRLVSREYNLKPETRVLLEISTPAFAYSGTGFFENCLRDALGHSLLYLRNPKAQNECPDAMREWRRNLAEVG